MLSPKDYLTKIHTVRNNDQPLNRAVRPLVKESPLEVFSLSTIIPITALMSAIFFVFFGAITFIVSFFINNNVSQAIYVGIGVGFGIAVINLISRIYSAIKLQKNKCTNIIQPAISNDIFGLYLGESTGKFYNLWHKASIKANQNIVLSLKDATHNILTLGAIGSGKTSRVMRPILLQLFDQDCGGLIFDIKGDVKEVVQKFVGLTNNKLKIIGVGQSKINLLAGLTPEIAASFLQSAFILNQGGKLEGFWVQTAGELCRNSLGVL